MSDTVNPKVIDAVQQATAAAFGYVNQSAGEPALQAGPAIALNKVSQSASFAVQDAVDYQRNMLSVLSVVQGKAYALMFSDPANISEYEKIITNANKTLGNVVETFTKISKEAGKAMQDFE